MLAGTHPQGMAGVKGKGDGIGSDSRPHGSHRYPSGGRRPEQLWVCAPLALASEGEGWAGYGEGLRLPLIQPSFTLVSIVQSRSGKEKVGEWGRE